MSLDATTKRQLVEARDKIVARLDELEFRVTGNTGGWRQRGPQDSGDIYDALKSELDEINQLLEARDEETSGEQSESNKVVPPSQPLEWPTPEPGVNARLWAVFQIGLVVIALGLAIAHSFR
jgi:hypothetical protein